MKLSQRVKLFIILGAEFLAVVVLLLLIFLAGKQSYTVRFDLNGGTLISGDLVQSVRQGGNATAPTVTKEGHYFLKWSESYNKVTKNIVVEAIWEYETTPGIQYNVISNTNYCTISGCYKGMQGDVYIGAYFDGKKVLGIEDGAFENCAGITNVYLLDGIFNIGKNAFAGCSSLKSVDLPETVAEIGEGAFKNCSALTEIVLPEALQTLGNNAFENCSALTSCKFNSSLITVGNNAFKNCTSLKEVEIPESVLTLGKSSFRDCAALEKVILHEGLTEIGEYAFYNCEDLEELTVPNSVLFEKVGVNAFLNTKLEFDVEYPVEKPLIIGPIIRPPRKDFIENLEKIPVKNVLEIAKNPLFAKPILDKNELLKN